MCSKTELTLFELAEREHHTVCSHGFPRSVVNRPAVNRRLIDGPPGDRPTGLTKINRQTDQKRSGLLDVDLVDLVLG